MTPSSSIPIEEDDAGFASRLFERENKRLRLATDKLSAKLLIIQALGGLVLLFTASIWISRSVLTDNLQAIASVGLLTAVPLALMHLKPGARMNGYVVAVCQVLISGLFIHMTSGRIESHFHTIGSLVFLSSYRNWRVLAWATSFITIDFVFRVWFMPASFYGGINASDYRWMEFAFWLILTDTFLMTFCQRRTEEAILSAREKAKLIIKETRYRAVVEQISEAVFLLDSETLDVTEYNNGLLQLLKKSADEVPDSLNLRDFSAIKPDQISAFVNELENGSHINGQTYFISDDGEHVPVEIRIVKILIGSESAFAVSAADITEQKKIEKQLREANDELEQRVLSRTDELKAAKEFYSTVIENLPIGVFVKDEELRYIIANKLIKESVGINEGVMAGMRDRDFPEKFEKHEEFEEDDRRILENLERSVIPEYVFTNAHGETRYCEIRKEPLIFSEGDAKCILGIVHDFTDRRSIEGELRQAQKLQSIGQLAAGIAHEINTPTQFVGDNLRFIDECFEDLNGLIGMFEKLLDSELTVEEQQKLFDDIEAEVDKIDLDYLKEEIPQAMSQSHEGMNRIAKIVESMREFSHPGTDEMKAVDLNKAIVSTVTVAKNQWKYVAELETELDDQLPLVPCLVGEFNQVVLNMIINATHAIEDANGANSNKKGLIRVSTNVVDENWIKISIADSGKGMPEDVKTKIFDPFFTTKEVGKGTGQGLAISHNVIVEKHNGKIVVESEEGNGTEFTIHLPVNSGGASPDVKGGG